MVIDSIDSEILRHLQIDGRMSYRELGDKVGLSSTAVASRMDRLIDARIISGFEVKVNHRALGNMIHALIDIRFNQSTYSDDFVTNIRQLENVEKARCVTGPFDCNLEVWVPTPEDLDRVLAAIKVTGDVAEMQTRLVLSTMKG